MSEESPANRPGSRPLAVQRRILLAQAALAWEDLLPRLWRSIALVAGFVGVTLLGLWLWLPGWLHIVILAAFVVLLPYFLWRDLPGWRIPGEAEALRRLELKSGFDHRPLTALEDSFAGDRRDSASHALWQAHRRRVRQAIKRLKVGWPASKVAHRDSYALRGIAGLVLVAGLVVGWQQAGPNFAAAFKPDFSRALASSSAGELTLWITPPAYTGVPPLWLDPTTAAETTEPVVIPAGSELVAQVRGGSQTPEVVIDEATTSFEQAGSSSFQITLELEAGSRLAFQQGGSELAAWPIDVIPDRVPTVALTEEPQETLRTTLRLDVAAEDDYGIENVRARISRVAVPDEIMELSVPIAHSGVREAKGPSFYDLTPHPWAGLDVTMQLFATDVTGQTGQSEIYTFKLPRRYFYHMVAREIADLRQALVQDPGLREETAEALAALTLDPEAYLSDVTVHLALITSANRLMLDQSDPGMDAVIALMWDTALAIEEGPLAFAERRVRDLQQQLLEALSEGATDDEIVQLIDELRQAMEDYMRALSNRLRTDPGELFDPTDALKAVGSRELTDLVDQLRDLVNSGSRDAAQTLLSRMQEIMENISVGNLSDLTGAVSAQAAEVLQTVRQLMSGQQELLDETFRMLREEDAEGVDSSGAFAGQTQLQQSLQELMERMEEFGFGAPREFDRADRSMGRSARQLENDRPGQAVDHQTEAIEQLRAGADALMESLMEQAGEEMAGEGQNFFGAPRDPMGRHLGGDGGEDTGDFQLPDRGAIVRAREILDELYKRASEQHRPVDEQQYLERLLRRF
ncbi:MAG: TIGR02302 family protein [Pseudomonadota bacterium]